MKRPAAYMLSFVFVALILAGCTSGRIKPEIIDGDQTVDGVTVTLQSATAVYVSDPGAYDYSFDVRIKNNSDENIMQVGYLLRTIGTDGEEIRSFVHYYDEETSALAPGKLVTDHIDSRWGPAEPAAIQLELQSVKTEAELPPMHLPQKGEYLYEALGNERLANILQNPPAELSVHIDQGGYGRTATFTKGESLDTALDLFYDIRIGDEANEWVTDNYNWIWLTWDDGATCAISLNLQNLEVSGHAVSIHTYNLQNLDAFWNYAAAHITEDGTEPQNHSD